MWKRWLNVFLCLWLVNSVTYFHASNPFDHSHEWDESTLPCLSLNSWTDCILQFVVNDSASVSRKLHKINVPRRFVHSRIGSNCYYLFVLSFLLLFINFKKKVHRSASQYSIGTALLPAYYNFLFRLSPF